MYKSMMMILIFIFVLIGCSKSSSDLSEVNQKDLNKDVLTFVKTIKESNGIYLYSKVNETQYLILNNRFVNQNEQATYINSIHAEVQDRTLAVKIEEIATDKLDDKRLGKLKIIKINRESDFDMIRIYKNEIETKFDLVGG